MAGSQFPQRAGISEFVALAAVRAPFNEVRRLQGSSSGTIPSHKPSSFQIRARAGIDF